MNVAPDMRFRQAQRNRRAALGITAPPLALASLPAVSSVPGSVCDRVWRGLGTMRSGQKEFLLPFGEGMATLGARHDR